MWTTDIHLRELLGNLHWYRNALRKFAEAKPDVPSALANLTSAYGAVLDALHQEKTAQILDEMMRKARDDRGTTGPVSEILLDAHNAEMLAREFALANNFGASASELRKMVANLPVVDVSAGPQTTRDLIVFFKRQHGALVEQFTAARQLDRKSKKKRKRDLLRGGLSGASGVGMIAANILFPPTWAFSYAFGAGALHQALRDIVGEPPKE